MSWHRANPCLPVEYLERIKREFSDEDINNFRRQYLGTWENDLKRMKDSDEMPFGKHKGEKLGDVPASYLLWLGDQADIRRKYPALFAYIDEGRAHLEREARQK